MKPESLKAQIFKINSDCAFEDLALMTFRFQAENVRTYRDYLHYLGTDISSVHSIKKIPFLPIEFFKSKRIITDGEKEEIIFLSSGTTGQNQSKHYVKDLHLYENSFTEGFNYFYGDITNYIVLALLPSYQEREGSSLIYMVNDLIEKSGNHRSGYFLYDLEELKNVIQQADKKVLLIGVTYALLDFAEQYPFEMKNTIIMETGGMKGRRQEMLREEVHLQLKKAFHVKDVHSEYGMTELLSQAYSLGNGFFKTPPWMKVLAREVNDPLSLVENGRTGGLNIIDLANVDSCSFIATQDLGRILPDHSFEVSGRFDNSDIRGCNLLVQ